MVELEGRFSDALGIRRWACMLGPSLGGMRVLEWLATHPERLASALVIAASAAVGADPIGSHQALRRSSQPLNVVGVDSVHLFPLEQQQCIATLAPGAGVDRCGARHLHPAPRTTSLPRSTP